MRKLLAQPGSIMIAAGLACLLAFLHGGTVAADHFDDVPNSHPYVDAILYVEDEGYVDGYEDDTFRPNAYINRAEFVKILTNARVSNSTINNCLSTVNRSPWSDVSLGAWFAKYLCVAKEYRVVDGYPDGTFRPGDRINAAEASKIVINAYGYGPLQAKVGENWFTPFVNKAFELGAFPFSISNVADAITRGEMAEMIYRMDIAIGKVDDSDSSRSTSGSRKKETNISYGENTLHKLDVYWKSSFDHAPIAVLVHGGGWYKGKKESMESLAERFRDDGYVVVTPNYRLTSDGKTEFPDPVADVACAVGWIRENAEDYGADENDILIGGESAGAHIAAMLAYDHERHWFDDQDCDTAMETHYDAFLGIVGVYDFDTVPNSDMKEQGEAFLGDLYSSSKWHVAEPINFVDANDPPAFILGGQGDTIVGSSNATLFGDKLRSVNVNREVVIAPGYGHDAKAYLLDNEDTEDRMFDFFEKYLPNN